MNKDLLILQNSRTWSKLQAFVHKSISENFLSVERSSKCFLDGRLSHDGQPSDDGLTFLALDDSYGRIGDGSIFSSPSHSLLLYSLSKDVIK